jgi:hypothetical protein
MFVLLMLGEGPLCPLPATTGLSCSDFVETDICVRTGIALVMH